MEITLNEWRHLDCLLDQLCESRGIPVMVWYHSGVYGGTAKALRGLLPKMMKRGNIGTADRDM